MKPSAQGRVFQVPAAETKPEVLKNFARSLNFPAYFGHNLDALEDSLRDFVAGLSEPSTLVWDVDARFRASQTYRTVLSILRGVEGERFQVVVRHLPEAERPDQEQ